jgi:hypothetical protein
MNINIDTTAQQDAFIQFKADEYNARLPKDEQGNPINPLTAKQFALQHLQTLFTAWRDEFRRWKLNTVEKAYVEGNDAKRAQIEAAAQ